MGTSLRMATNDDSACIADIYLTSRKHFLPYAPLAHTDDAVRSWIRDKLITTGGVTVFYHQHGFRDIELSDGALNEERTPDVLLEWP
jgi:hypothetical protein